MQQFRVDLKTFLGLATTYMPNQYSQSVRKQISSWFWGDNFGQKSLNLHDPYNIVLLYCMIHSYCGIKLLSYSKYYSCNHKIESVFEGPVL